MARQLEKTNIQLALEYTKSAKVRADSHQLKQVIINLVQNAADAIGQQGCVTLRSRCERRRLSDRETNVVILEVSDTGKGIPPEVEKRLFDPFFSTKESGTGLGLSIAARIVQKHGGVLQYQTQVNHGTTFGIVLPQA
jgi:signal transduction histidine kinase